MKKVFFFLFINHLICFLSPCKQNKMFSKKQNAELLQTEKAFAFFS